MTSFWTDFFTFITFYILGLISPGPDCALIIRTSLYQSLRRSWLTTLGTACAVLVHSSYCMLGAGMLITSSPTLSWIMRASGAIYLIYLGWNGLNSKAPSPAQLNSTPLNEDGESKTAQPLMRYWLEGFFTAMVNPKGIFFILSLFTQVIHPKTPMSVQMLYVLIMFTCSLLWFGGLSLTLIKSQKLISIDRVQYYVLKFMGVAMIALGIKIGLIP